MEPVGGSMLGRYEVIRHLASGGMADLLLAKASGLEGFERHVVIKRIRADAEDDQAFIDMFLVEARLAGALHHHNIVQVYDVGEEKGKPYFAMEYVHGENLRRLLATVVQKREQLPLPVVVTIVTAVARALHHAHEQKGSDQQPLGIVHRDVSPANIVVGYDGNVKVLDFGIARAAMRRTETQAGMLKGKAPYMAPEQCTGAPVDRRSDVFALGIVLYELATARRLFKAENDHLTMMTIVHGTIPKPSTIRKGLPPDLERIIMRALSRDPASRYQTAEQLFTALEQLALTAEWRTSASVLATYMTQLFGSRTEPWLSSEPIAGAVSVDFDGVGPGVAGRADTDPGAVPTSITSTTSSPIMRTRPDAQASSGVPKAADATVSSPIKIPDQSASVGTKSSATKAAARVPVKATPPRGHPKTVQVPVAKADPKRNDATVDMTPTAKVAAKSEAKPTAKANVGPASLEATAVLALPVTPAKPDAKVATPLEDTDVVAPIGVASRLKTDVMPTTRASATSEVTRVDRPKTEVDAPRRPIMDEPEETHTEAQALPPSVSPHAPRQLKPLPAPNVSKQLTPKPVARIAAPATAAKTAAASPAPATGASTNGASTNGASTNGKSADASITSPTVASSPASKMAAAAAALAASADDFAEDRSTTASDFEESTDVASIPTEDDSGFTRRSDPTAIVVPLPSPLRTDSPRARRKSTAPANEAMGLVEDTDQRAASARPRWMLPAIGGGVLVLAIIVFAIASGGDDALDAPPPETASVTEPPKPDPVAAPAPDEVRTEAQPRTWANSQQADPAGSDATPTPPAPVPTPATKPVPPAPPAPDPTPAIKPEPSAPDPTPPSPPIAAEPGTDTAAVIPPTEPDPMEPTEPKDPGTDATDIKPAVATTKPVTKPATKPKAVPAIAKTTKPAPKPAPKPKPATVAKAPKPKPTAKPTAKPLPKANWNPNSLFPNKK